MPTTATTTAKKRLLDRRATITRRRTGNEADTNVLLSERRGEERAANAEIADVLVRLSDRERQELGELDAALARIERGTWGRCEKCNRAIAARRLRAFPEARSCIAC